MKKICVPITGRAPYGRLKSVLKAINEHPDLELQLIVCASALLDKYGCVDQIEKDGFKIDAKVYCCVDGDTPSTMATTTGLLTTQLVTLFDKFKPDIVLAHADRYEALAVAQAAAYSNITLAHTQGGELSGSIDDKVRNSITQLADIHFVSTEQSSLNVLNSLNNARDKNIHIVGCPSIDLLNGLDLSINENLNMKYPAVGKEINYSDPYMVVMFHPVTACFDYIQASIITIIKSLIDFPKDQVLWFWPNVDSGSDIISRTLRKYREQGHFKNVRFVKNFSPEDFYRAIFNCSVFIGNSSSGIREGSYLGVPYICIGERQNQREHGLNCVFVRENYNSIFGAIKNIKGSKFDSDYLFGDGTAGEKIAEILSRYEHE